MDQHTLYLYLYFYLHLFQYIFLLQIHPIVILSVNLNIWNYVLRIYYIKIQFQGQSLWTFRQIPCQSSLDALNRIGDQNRYATDMPTFSTSLSSMHRLFNLDEFQQKDRREKTNEEDQIFFCQLCSWQAFDRRREPPRGYFYLICSHEQENAFCAKKIRH